MGYLSSYCYAVTDSFDPYGIFIVILLVKSVFKKPFGKKKSYNYTHDFFVQNAVAFSVIDDLYYKTCYGDHVYNDTHNIHIVKLCAKESVIVKLNNNLLKEQSLFHLIISVYDAHTHIHTNIFFIVDLISAFSTKISYNIMNAKKD
ncbi:hypothetical protein PUN28_008652 [Cardiocondyla obscurior]|uniref:Uncharacterized protein n=1 Tax=Cardiocondyla obscurior TaxID=286306 RepID=A0AAW2FYK5_9HYME